MSRLLSSLNRARLGGRAGRAAGDGGSLLQRLAQPRRYPALVRSCQPGDGVRGAGPAGQPQQPRTARGNTSLSTVDRINIKATATGDGHKPGDLVGFWPPAISPASRPA